MFDLALLPYAEKSIENLAILMRRLEDHVEWSGPETLRKFDKRMAAATDVLKEGLEWGDIINAGGSPAPLLGLHTSHPTEQVCK